MDAAALERVVPFESLFKIDIMTVMLLKVLFFCLIVFLSSAQQPELSCCTSATSVVKSVDSGGRLSGLESRLESGGQVLVV